MNDKNNKLPLYQVLFALMAGEKLTVQKAFRLFHTTELRKIVSRLRRKGYDIKDRILSAETDGRISRFKEYFMATANK